MENVSIIAQLKKKKPTDATGTIIIRGYFNRKPVTAKSTGYKIQVAHWDPELRQVKSIAPNARLINSCIQIKLQEMQGDLMKKEIAGHRPNRTAVFKAIKGIDDAKDFIFFCKERIRIEYQKKETIRSYMAECTKLEQFRATISFADVDYEFLSDYKKYMIDQLRNDENTIWKSFKFMNTMLRKAMAIGGIIHSNPFEAFDRGKYIQKPKKFLEVSDLDKIEEFLKKDDQPILLRRVAIRFIFMCYSGMRFSDAMAFDPDQHLKDGRISMNYQKFDTDVNNLMYNRLKAIVDLLKEAPLKLSNQKFNQYLKLLQAACGIKTNLTSHLGRHTMGSMLVDANISMESAQLILGHKDPKSTKVYYHQKNRNIDAEMNKLNSL